MASDRIKPTPSAASTTGYYQKTDWKTGDIITRAKMMNIEDWLASATDELLEARAGLSVEGAAHRWSNIKERIDYITGVLQIITPSGVDPVLDRINEATHNAEVATERANDAAELIEDFTAVIPATATRLGAIKIGDSLVIDGNGVTNTIQNEYELAISTNNWVLQNNKYVYIISNISNITSNIRCKAYLDHSYFNLISDLEIETTDQNEIIFRTSTRPTGTIKGYFVLERTNQED